MWRAWYPVVFLNNNPFSRDYNLLNRKHSSKDLNQILRKCTLKQYATKTKTMKVLAAIQKISPYLMTHF